MCAITGRRLCEPNARAWLCEKCALHHTKHAQQSVVDASIVHSAPAGAHDENLHSVIPNHRKRGLIGRYAGSGRESLTHLATSMAGSSLVRVNVTHDYGVQKFEQDLRKAVLTAGIDAKHTVFLLKDAQVRHRWNKACRRWVHTGLGSCLLGGTSYGGGAVLCGF